jgi:hypothetical protein
MTWRASLGFTQLALLATLVAGCAASAGDEDPPGEGNETAGPDGEGGGTGGSGRQCSNVPCDLYDQCGCEAGQACDLDNSSLATGATECRPVTEPGQSQANCSRDDQCAAGYGCFGNPGQCRRFCERDGACGLGHCIIQIVYDAGGGDYQPVPDAMVCTKACKPESSAGSGCPQSPQMACNFSYRDPNGQPDSGDEFWYTDCRPAGTGGDAADCSAGGDRDCRAGFGCFGITYTDDSVRSECRQICVWEVSGQPGARSCATGECRKLAGDGVVVGDTEYGVCL